MIRNPLFDIGFTLVILGIIVIFVVGMLLILRRSKGLRGGGIIMIGPFPIIFGSDASTVKVLVIVVIAFMAIFLIMNLLLAQTF